MPSRNELKSINEFNSGYVSDAEPVVIGGCGRSGTTLIRIMLDSHRNICCGPESSLFFEEQVRFNRLAKRFHIPSEEIRLIARDSTSRGEFIERFFGEYVRRSGKRRWAEKSPPNVERLDYIFETFPRTRFIHMVRDGRDVVCSLRTHPRNKVVEGKLVPLNTWNPLEPCIERWVSAIDASRPYRSDPRYLEVRYEDLVLDTRTTIHKVLDFIAEPWDDRVLEHSETGPGFWDVTKFPQNPEAVQPITDKSIERWRWDLSPEDQNLFKERAGQLLVELGYESSNDW